MIAQVNKDRLLCTFKYVEDFDEKTETMYDDMLSTIDIKEFATTYPESYYHFKKYFYVSGSNEEELYEDIVEDIMIEILDDEEYEDDEW